MYMKVISSLGLEYSPAKTHISLHFYEFAKRMFLDGVEITPFPVSALKECGKTYYMLATLLFEQNMRNWVPIVSFGSSVANFFGVVLHLPSSFKRKMKIGAEQCIGVLSLVHGLIPADTLINK